MSLITEEEEPQFFDIPNDITSKEELENIMFTREATAKEIFDFIKKNGITLKGEYIVQYSITTEELEPLMKKYNYKIKQ